MHKFLVADDHPLFRDALVAVIRARFEHCEILQSEDIERTLDTVKDHQDLDLVLLDLNMPGMAGLKGLLELRNQYPTIPSPSSLLKQTNRSFSKLSLTVRSGLLPKVRRKKKCVKPLNRF